VTCSFNAPLPAEDGHGVAAPGLSTWHVHVIAVTPDGTRSFTVAGAAATPALLSTVTVYVALLPAFTLAGPLFVRIKPSPTFMYKVAVQEAPLGSGPLKFPSQLPFAGAVTLAKSSTGAELFSPGSVCAKTV
jgi:hypothetical protein